MKINDAIEFLRDRRHGVLITQKADGRPQSSNIVYLVDDDGRIVISVTDDRAKTRNLRRTNTASLHVNRDDFWAYAVVEADVSFTPVATSGDDETVEALIAYYRTMVGEHDDWDEYRAAMIAEGRLLITLTPTHAYGMLNR
ncbi:MAG: PPOX class F420-dependent oxidoreductase [Ilumatobacter sp.]